MNHPAIDAYLDELLDLTVEAVAPVPAAANAPVVELAPPRVVSVDLLAELESDPLFAPQAEPDAQPEPLSAAVVMPAVASAPLAVSADLLAELESDPLFSPQPEPSSSSVERTSVEPALAAIPAPVATPPPSPLLSRPAMPAAAPAPAAPIARPAVAPAPTDIRATLTPRASAPAVTSTYRWLRVAVGEDSYALELLRVQEVVRTTPIVAMRGAKEFVLGAMNLRGRIVPVLDLGLWLGTGRVTPDERARIVVVERDNELIGALVSVVDDVVTLGPDRIEPPLMASPSRAIVGVARVVAKPTVLLDANALFG